jgi:hypothetical protein
MIHSRQGRSTQTIGGIVKFDILEAEPVGLKAGKHAGQATTNDTDLAGHGLELPNFC